jgi:hypothetical protein
VFLETEAHVYKVRKSLLCAAATVRIKIPDCLALQFAIYDSGLQPSNTRGHVNTFLSNRMPQGYKWKFIETLWLFIQNATNLHSQIGFYTFIVVIVAMG